MADNRYSWLDGAAAEHLLRGETADALAAVGPDDVWAREQVRRLGAAVESVAELPPVVLSGERELPGEAAAVQAFRRARQGSGRSARSRRSWSLPIARPLLAGLGVTLSAALVGGAALAAAKLPEPFGNSWSPASPGGTVSAVGTPAVTSTASPSVLPSREHENGGRSVTGAEGDPHERKHGPAKRSHPPVPGKPGGGPTGSAGAAVDADVCREYRDGTLDAKHRAALEKAAGGPEALERQCDEVLADVPGNGGESRSGKGAEHSESPTPEPTESGGSSSTPSPMVSVPVDRDTLSLAPGTLLL